MVAVWYVSRPTPPKLAANHSQSWGEMAHARIVTAMTRRAPAGMAAAAIQERPLDHAICCLAAPFKSCDRVKSLVTLAGGFPSIVRPLTRWPAVWFIFRDMSDSLERLYQAVIAAKDLDPSVSRTARLFQRGPDKMAKKLAEEAIEVVIDAVNGKTDAVVRESADLLYNLTVLWAAAGVRPEHLLGIAEKMPKAPVKVPPARRPIVALEGRALRKRH
jgi:phosphoribosyl-ATP pyrophosphohydrolase